MPVRPSRRQGFRSGRVLAVVCALAAAIQALALDGWFAYDDPWFLASATRFGFWEYARRSFDVTAVGSLPELDRYRPLWPIWFRLQYELFGLRGAPYHAVAIGLHLVTVLLVHRLARRLGLSPGAANATAALFALHPAYVEAVAWVGGSNRVVVAVPAVASLLAWLSWWERGRASALVAALAGYGAANLLHPTAVTLAVAYPALAWLSGSSGKNERGRGELVAWAALAALTTAFVAIQAWVRFGANVASGFSLGWHLWANFGAFLGMAAAPLCQSSGGCFRSPVSTLTDAAMLVGSATVVVGVLLLARRAPVRSLPVVALAWFVVTLAPDAALRMGAFGRTMYLAGVPLSLLVVSAWQLLSPPLGQLAGHSRRLAFVAGGVLLVAAVVGGYFVWGVRQAGRENLAFVAALRQAYPHLPVGTVLIVDDAPSNLVTFDDSRLQALVEVYYPGVVTRSAARSESLAGEGSIVRFDFRP